MIVALSGIEETCDAFCPGADYGEGLGGRFLSAARRHARHPALVTPSRTFSYQSLAHASLGVASYLSENAHFAAGRCVAVLAGNSAEYLAALYGTLLAGGIAVPLSERTPPSRLRQVRTDCPALSYGEPQENRFKVTSINTCPFS